MFRLPARRWPVFPSDDGCMSMPSLPDGVTGIMAIAGPTDRSLSAGHRSTQPTYDTSLSSRRSPTLWRCAQSPLHAFSTVGYFCVERRTQYRTLRTAPFCTWETKKKVADMLRATMQAQPETAIVTFGGSYGANLAMWLRLKNPNKLVTILPNLCGVCARACMRERGSGGGGRGA